MFKYILNAIFVYFKSIHYIFRMKQQQFNHTLKQNETKQNSTLQYHK